MKNCDNCEHITCHYIVKRKGFIKTSCGHCYPKGKSKKVGRVCKYYSQSTLSQPQFRNLADLADEIQKNLAKITKFIETITSL